MTRSFASNPESSKEEHLPSLHPGSIGRIKAIEHMQAAVASETGPAIQLLRGEVGSGRTTLLNALGEHLRSGGRPVYQVTCLPGHHLAPCRLAHRLIRAPVESASAPAPPSESLGEPRTSQETPRPRPDLRVFGADDLLSLLDRAFRVQGPAIVLIDDAQHADPESISLLHCLVSRHTSLRLVMSVAPVRAGWPAEQQDERAALAQLLDDPTVGIVDLPPLSADDIARILAARLRAVPDEGLVAELHRLSGGNPAAAEAAVSQAESDVIRVLIGHAHLVSDAGTPVLPKDDRFVRTVRGLGDVVWRVAKALSLVEHMGSMTVRLIATATGLSDSTVSEALDRLMHYGFVTGPDDEGAAQASGWAFRIPLVARAVQARLGPYERRVTSATAVRALWETPADEAGGIWAGQGHDDPSGRRAYLADRIVDAGTLLDRKRAARELFSVAEQLRTTHRRKSSSWLRAAVERSDDPVLSLSTVTAHASEAIQAGNGYAMEDTVRTLVHAQAQAPDTATQRTLAAVEMARLAATGDLDELSVRYQAQIAVADQESAVLAVQAASLLGLWSEVRELIERSGLDRHPRAPERSLGTTFRAVAMAMCGEPALLYKGLQEPPTRGTDLPAMFGALGTTLLQCEALLALGDLKGFTAFLRERGLKVDRLPRQDVFLQQFFSGAWREAMANARWLMVNSLPTRRVPVSTLVHVKASTILLAQGWPSRARTVLDIARSTPTSMAYLLDPEEAAIHRFLGRAEETREAVRRGLAAAADAGCVSGTGQLWSALAILEATEGHPEAALRCLGELRNATAAADDVGHLLYLRSRIEAVRLSPALRDRLTVTAADGQNAVAVARSLGQPYELALTLLLAATATPCGERCRNDLLQEAYEQFGHLDAFLWRHRTRLAMKSAGTPIPERRNAAQEMEVLLARLVAEGLSNRLLATALSMSETSVSSRLNRLFRRTGLRSRVELATAVATGDPLFSLRD